MCERQSRATSIGLGKIKVNRMNLKNCESVKSVTDDAMKGKHRVDTGYFPKTMEYSLMFWVTGKGVGSSETTLDNIQ